ncbi:MAG: hypothetical protein F4W95_14285 [Chloroflexi bacterium]|nr:hypothetical protein [Chloroflexota bacterium]MYD49629.1 hypothetical protein [Chloroflexota bacterium]
MHDGITLEQQGIPAATIITTVFANTARAYTRLMGVPDFPYLMCQHPITNAGADGLQERARALTPGVRSLLINGALTNN